MHRYSAVFSCIIHKVFCACHQLSHLVLLIMSLFAVMPLVFPQDNYAYAASDELLDLEEEKSDIEDEIAEREANGESYDDLEERRNDVQDEIQNIKDEG